MSRKMFIVVGLIVLLLANLAVSAMAAAQVEAGAPASPPDGTRPANGGITIKLTPVIHTNGGCDVPGSSTCPPATPGG